MLINDSHCWSEPDLFILLDRRLIERCEGARYRVCAVEKHPEPVIKPDNPWEGLNPDGSVDSLQDPFYAAVIFDPIENHFKCYYAAPSRYVSQLYKPPYVNQSSHRCFATSRDGIHWDKPKIRQVLYMGSLENNILSYPKETLSYHWRKHDNPIPFLRTNSGIRFARAYGVKDRPGPLSWGITLAFSADGIHWVRHDPPLLPCPGEGRKLNYDSFNDVFLLTGRSAQHMNLCARWEPTWKRHICLMKSKDMLHWTPEQTVFEVDDRDPDDCEIYSMKIIPYGHLYIGQILMFYKHEMVLDNQWCFSDDLEHWHRTPGRRPCLERGPEGAWDCKHVALTANLPHPEGKRMRVWYGGASAPHYQAGYGAMGTGTLRIDGLACYENHDAQQAGLTTIPFRVQNRFWLALNVDASDGEVTVELLNEDYSAVEGFTRSDCVPVHGDHIRKIVTFTTNSTPHGAQSNWFRLHGRTVRLRFHLNNARLYAFKAPGLQPVIAE